MVYDFTKSDCRSALEERLRITFDAHFNRRHAALPCVDEPNDYEAEGDFSIPYLPAFDDLTGIYYKLQHLAENAANSFPTSKPRLSIQWEKDSFTIRVEFKADRQKTVAKQKMLEERYATAAGFEGI